MDEKKLEEKINLFKTGLLKKLKEIKRFKLAESETFTEEKFKEFFKSLESFHKYWKDSLKDYNPVEIKFIVNSIESDIIRDVYRNLTKGFAALSTVRKYLPELYSKKEEELWDNLQSIKDRIGSRLITTEN